MLGLKRSTKFGLSSSYLRDLDFRVMTWWRIHKFNGICPTFFACYALLFL